MTHARLEVVFQGHVQGVGFRMTAARCAERFGVVGWVRNEPDGSVRLVAEGTVEKAEGLLECIEEMLPGHVRSKTVDHGPGSGEFSGFRILRSPSHR